MHEFQKAAFRKIFPASCVNEISALDTTRTIQYQPMSFSWWHSWHDIYNQQHVSIVVDSGMNLSKTYNATY